MPLMRSGASLQWNYDRNHMRQIRLHQLVWNEIRTVIAVHSDCHILIQLVIDAARKQNMRLARRQGRTNRDHTTEPGAIEATAENNYLLIIREADYYN